MWRMTRCAEGGDAIDSYTVVGAISAWVEGSLPSAYIIEDAATWGGTGAYWVTGDSCSAPE